MAFWGLTLTIIILLLGLALGAFVFRVVWLFCQGCGAVEKKPWEE